MSHWLAEACVLRLLRRSMHLSAGASVLALLGMVATIQGRPWLAWPIIVGGFYLSRRARIYRLAADRIMYGDNGRP